MCGLEIIREVRLDGSSGINQESAENGCLSRVYPPLPAPCSLLPFLPWAVIERIPKITPVQIIQQETEHHHILYL